MRSFDIGGSMRSLDVFGGDGSSPTNLDDGVPLPLLSPPGSSVGSAWEPSGLKRMATAAAQKAASAATAAQTRAKQALGGGVGGGGGEDVVTSEKGLTPLHYLFRRPSEDFGFIIMFELCALDEECFSRTTSWDRTPLHHLFQYNKHLSSPLLTALHASDERALIKRDRWGNTPLCRYFKRNPTSAGMDVDKDSVVRVLCSAPGIWGLTALSRSNEAYTDTLGPAPGASARFAAGRLPPKFSDLLGGNLFEVETFVHDFMMAGEEAADEDLAMARLKFLFVLLPLRTPTRYGLTPTQGLQLVTRVLVSIENVYADASGKGAESAKLKWMDSFADAALYMIQDEQMLRGMLSDPPSKAAVEALSSTEFMTTVLAYKFNSGPILLFIGEFALHLILLVLLVTNMVGSHSSVYLAAPSLLITTYFTAREVHYMQEVRTQELASYEHGRDQAAWGGIGQRAARRHSIWDHGTDHAEAAQNAKVENGVSAAMAKARFRRAILETAKTIRERSHAGGAAAETTRLPSQSGAGGDGDSFRSAAAWTVNPTFRKLAKKESLSQRPLGATVGRKGGSDSCAELGIEMQQSSSSGAPTRQAAVAFTLAEISQAMNDSAESRSGDDIDDTGGEGGGGFDALIEGTSRFVTVYLGLAESWRSSVFNWINLGSHVCCWITVTNMLIEAARAHNVSANDDSSGCGSSQTDNDNGSSQPWARGREGVVAIHVATTFFLSLRVLGFLRGTSIEMATFVLMLQEISWKVQTFLVVLVWILVGFALMYHILLAGEDLDDDSWDTFFGSVWKIWGYAVSGELDDTAFPTAQAYPLFAIFGLAIVIVMMNILIAIVSDAFADSMRRSAPLYWRARVDLIASYEHVLPTLDEKEAEKAILATRVATPHAGMTKRQPPPTKPRTWQYRCLKFQEGIFATALVGGIVMFEFIFVGNLRDCESTEDQAFLWSLSVSSFFLVEILLRYYNWWHSLRTIRTRDGGVASAEHIGLGDFFSDKFRLLDASLVIMDLCILTLDIALRGSGGGTTRGFKAGKLARMLRFARGFRGARVLRSCRFFAKLMARWRRYVRPSKRAVVKSLTEALRTLDEADSWAGRVTDLGQSVKREVERSTNRVLAALDGDGETEEARLRLAATEAATFAADAACREVREVLSSEVKELRDAVEALRGTIKGCRGAHSPGDDPGDGSPAAAATSSGSGVSGEGDTPGDIRESEGVRPLARSKTAFNQGSTVGQSDGAGTGL